MSRGDRAWEWLLEVGSWIVVPLMIVGLVAIVAIEAYKVLRRHAARPRAAPQDPRPAAPGAGGAAVSRLVFVQSERWCKRFAGTDAGDGVYSEDLCAYCARPVRPGATRLRTARTNDGEWWLVSVDEDLSGHEWKDFQTQIDADGTRAPTLLPIGPDCLRDHPEFSFAVAPDLDDLPFMGTPTPKPWHAEKKKERS